MHGRNTFLQQWDVFIESSSFHNFMQCQSGRVGNTDAYIVVTGFCSFAPLLYYDGRLVKKATRRDG